jgi:hypothetical protein
MMAAEHRRPFAAFLMVFAVACVIIGNGLRTQVVEVLIDSGAPQEVITAVAPDMLLGEALRRAPKSRPAATPDRAETTDEASADVETLVQPVPPSVTLAQWTVRDRSTGGSAGSKSNDQSGSSPVAVPPTAPVVVIPPSEPVLPTKPEPGQGSTPTPGKRPWQPLVPLVPMLSLDRTSPDDGEGHWSIGWGRGHSHIDDGQHGLIKGVVRGLVRDQDGEEFGDRSTDKSRGRHDEAKPRSHPQTSGHDHSDSRPATVRQSEPRGDRRRSAEQRDRSRGQRATFSTPAAPAAVAPSPHNRQRGDTRTEARHESRHDSRAATRNESRTESRGRDHSDSDHFDRGNRGRSGHGR